MATLEGQQVKNSYKDLLQVSNSNAGVDDTLRHVEDGEGTESALKISTSAVTVSGSGGLTITTGPLEVSGTARFHGGMVVRGPADIPYAGDFQTLSGDAVFRVISRDVDPNSDAIFRLATTGSGSCYFEFGDNDDPNVGYWRYINPSNIFQFFTNATKRYEIGTDGNLIYNNSIEVSGTAVFHETVSVSGKVKIGSGPSRATTAHLHVAQSGESGLSDGQIFTGVACLLERQANASLQLAVGASSASSYIFFGAGYDDDGDKGYIRYQHATDQMLFRVAGNNPQFTISTAATIISNPIEVSGTARFHNVVNFEANATAAGTPASFSADGWIAIQVSGVTKYLPYSNSEW